jgi:hypothetical protein
MSDDASPIDLESGKFPVLTSSNFTEWLDLAETALVSKGLWEELGIRACGIVTTPIYITNECQELLDNQLSHQFSR